MSVLIVFGALALLGVAATAIAVCRDGYRARPQRAEYDTRRPQV